MPTYGDWVDPVAMDAESITDEPVRTGRSVGSDNWPAGTGGSTPPSYTDAELLAAWRRSINIDPSEDALVSARGIWSAYYEVFPARPDSDTLSATYRYRGITSHSFVRVHLYSLEQRRARAYGQLLDDAQQVDPSVTGLQWENNEDFGRYENHTLELTETLAHAWDWSEPNGAEVPAPMGAETVTSVRLLREANVYGNGNLNNPDYPVVHEMTMLSHHAPSHTERFPIPGGHVAERMLPAMKFGYGSHLKVSLAPRALSQADANTELNEWAWAYTNGDRGHRVQVDGTLTHSAEYYPPRYRLVYDSPPRRIAHNRIVQRGNDGLGITGGRRIIGAKTIQASNRRGTAIR